MKTVWKATLTCLLLGPALLAGCGDAANPTDEHREYERPAETRDFISDARLAEIEGLGFEVHDGNSPPDISGTYRWDSFVETYEVVDDDNDGICDAEITFVANDDGTLSTEKVYSSCSGSGTSNGLYISGKDNCFTTYLREDLAFEGCQARTVILYSGCLGQDGIEDFKRADYNTEFLNDTCETLVADEIMPDIGDLRISVETDGLLSSVD